ncbi:MAG TPA: alpha/beta hydrolase [Urbifossiella sp.]|nr:alpha/beta hydrolase [Urbifossiella sp.]
MRPYLTGLLLLCPAAGLAADEKTFDADGVKLAYREEGVATGTPVVLVHGYLADNRTQWDSPAAGGPKVVDALAKTKKYRIILLDSRGHGKSDKPVDRAKYGAEMAADVGRLMKHLGVDKAHVVGYSMGSWAAQKFAADHPDKVRSLTVGGAGRLDDGSEAGLKLLAATVKGYGGGVTGSEAMLKEVLQGRLDLPNRADVPALVAAAGEVGGLRLTPAQAVSYPGPVLGLVGENDTLKPNVQALQKARVDAGRKMTVVIVPGGHLSAPATPEFSTGLVDFLGKN